MGEIEERSRDLGLTDPGSDSAWRTGGREPGSLPRYVSQILRLNEREAVVISASRIGEDPQWRSAQYTCDLRTEVPARGPALGRGGRRGRANPPRRPRRFARRCAGGAQWGA